MISVPVAEDAPERLTGDVPCLDAVLISSPFSSTKRNSAMTEDVLFPPMEKSLRFL